MILHGACGQRRLFDISGLQPCRIGREPRASEPFTSQPGCHCDIIFRLVKSVTRLTQACIVTLWTIIADSAHKRKGHGRNDRRHSINLSFTKSTGPINGWCLKDTWQKVSEVPKALGFDRLRFDSAAPSGCLEGCQALPADVKSVASL